jgi:gamma-glutamyl-gamma-aminobutyraldehyde dehydrogenase
VRDALLDKLVAVTQTWHVGDPMEPTTRIGPMITRSHMDRIRLRRA